MSDSTRDERLGGALATLAKTLVSDYDVVQMLHAVVGECVALVDAQGVGLLLRNAHGALELVASSSEGASFVEVMQLNAGDGPCVESADTGAAVSVADVEEVRSEWKQFREAALAEGYHSSHAVPLRIDAQVVGAMGLYRTDRGEMDEADTAVAQALANLAAIGIVQERALRDRGLVVEQLQRALDSRIFIEQAKGVVAASLDVAIEEAFRLLLAHAEANDLKLHDVAHGVIERRIVIGAASSHEPGR